MENQEQILVIEKNNRKINYLLIIDIVFLFIFIISTMYVFTDNSFSSIRETFLRLNYLSGIIIFILGIIGICRRKKIAKSFKKSLFVIISVVSTVLGALQMLHIVYILCLALMFITHTNPNLSW